MTRLRDKRALAKLKEVFFLWLAALPIDEVTRNRGLWEAIKDVLRAFRAVGV